MHAAGYSFPGKDNDLREWWPMVAVSMLGHVLIFASLILAPFWTPEPYAPPPHISIDLRAAPPVAKSSEEAPESPGPLESTTDEPDPVEPRTETPDPVEPRTETPDPVEPRTDAPDPAEPRTNEPDPVEFKADPVEPPSIIKTPDMPPLFDKKAPAEEKPALIIKKFVRPEKKDVPAPRRKLKPKRSLKKKTYKSARVKEQAIDKIRKDIDASRSESVESAIDRIRRNVESTRPEGKDEVADAGREGGIPGGVPGGMGASSDIMDVYNAEIAYRISRNWAFSKQLADGRRDLEAVILLKILRSGEIQDIRFEKKSGNDYLDESAMRAVEKSRPLPGLPKAYPGPYYTIGFIFDEKGLK